jgi:cobalt-zinc-cadmium resistance protein CzcA
MIGRLLEFSLRQRLLVAGSACLLAAWGLYAAQKIPIDAFPDVTTVQVMIATQMPGQPPVDVERFVTIPVEIHLMGLQGLTEIRSLSKFGLSQITVVFNDDVDVYFARQLVLERLIEVKRRLPPNVEPLMMPVSTGLGEVYQYYLIADEDLPDGPARERRMMDMRTTQDWVIRPLLKGQPGVIEVNSLGGFVKQYQVIVDPDRLRKYNLALHDVFQAVSDNNANVGGNIVERYTEQYIVRGVGMIQKLEDIGNIVVKEEAGVPVFVRDVAEVGIGHAVRHGAALVNGREAVAGIVLMLRGANARDVVGGIKEKVGEINRSRLLPEGWKIVPFYDRIELITAALGTMQYALLEGIALLILVALPFLGHLRGAVIVTIILLLTPLVTFIVMERLGLSANLMSLGGLAIAIGEIADGAIVIVENAHRHLADPRAASIPRPSVILRAAKEVGRPIAFSILIITVVFLPLLTLHGMEGKMFQPLAHTMVIALLVSLVLSLTLVPVLCSWLLTRRGDVELRLLQRLKAGYLPVLRWALAHRRLVAGLAGVLCLMSVALVPFLGREFVPIMDEGTLTPQIIRHPSVSLPHAIELERQVHQALLEFPESRLAVSKIGRSEISNTPEEPNESDPVITLAPRDTWTTAATKGDLVEAMRKRLAVIPGISLLMSQPIQERVDELISGIRTEIAVKLSGDDLDVLKDKAEQIAAIMKTVEGVRDVKMEQLFGQTYLTVTIDRDRIARHGINVADVQQIIATAVGGMAATLVYERERRFDLVLRFPAEARTSVQAISNILIRDPTGTSIPLGDLTTVELREGPAQISRERLHRRIAIGFNVSNRDIAGVVAEGRKKIEEQVELPEGYAVTWGGAFENMQRAMARLAIVVPVTVVLIFLLLFSSMRSLRYAALILVNVPLALIGGVLALWLAGEYLSVPASVGFISLFGVAVGNGIVLISYIHELRRTGASQEDAIVTGCLLRLRPVLMTTLTTLLGLLPLAFAQGIGAEVQRPLAVVVIGGILSSTLLTLVVLPALFPWFEEPAGEPPLQPPVRARVADERARGVGVVA